MPKQIRNKRVSSRAKSPEARPVVIAIRPDSTLNFIRFASADGSMTHILSTDPDLAPVVRQMIRTRDIRIQDALATPFFLTRQRLEERLRGVVDYRAVRRADLAKMFRMRGDEKRIEIDGILEDFRLGKRVERVVKGLWTAGASPDEMQIGCKHFDPWATAIVRAWALAAPRKRRKS